MGGRCGAEKDISSKGESRELYLARPREVFTKAQQRRDHLSTCAGGYPAELRTALTRRAMQKAGLCWPSTPRNSHPCLPLDEKNSFWWLSAGVLPSERHFCNSGHS